ncbi:MAG: hypothetical protein ACM4AI_15720 [Acidobacteriota bacterium]
MAGDIGSANGRSAAIATQPGAPALAQAIVLISFLAIVAVQWRVYGSIPGPDAIAYLTTGVNLASTGSFTNLAGRPEVWFPPFYPLLIGVASAGGTIDPATAGRLISITMAVLGLILTGHIARTIGARRYEPALAMLLLAANPIYQRAAMVALSESTATTLALAAFALWLRIPDRSTSARWLLIGALVALSYLSRPEGLLLLPLWALLDAFRSGLTPQLARRYALAAAAALAIVLPYLVYLHLQTGEWTLTGKTAVNLASGRATYLGLPRDYIDPATLEMGFWKYDVTLAGEARRFLWNAARILAEYFRNLGALLAVPVVIGALALARARQWRILLGVASFFVYLLVLAVFEVKNRYLHLTLPCLSIVAAHGLTWMFESLRRAPRSSRASRLPAAVATALLAGVAVVSLAAVRENLADRSGYALLRDAGVRLGGLGVPNGVVYERWGDVAYYAGYRTRPLTPNDLQTILRFIDTREAPGTPVYVVVSTMESYTYDPTVQALIESPESAPRLRQLFSLSSADGKVVVYELRGRVEPSAGSR